MKLSGIPGSGQISPQSPLPAGAVAGGGWIEPKRVRQVLARVNNAGAQNLTAAVQAWVDNPVARLICSISLSFEPDTQQDVSSFNSSVWSITAMRIGEGRTAELHSVFSNETLPQQYEVATSARAFLVEATLAIPQTAAAAAIPGNWVLQVEWEPGMPMCEAEVAALYARCNAKPMSLEATPLAP